MLETNVAKHVDMKHFKPSYVESKMVQNSLLQLPVGKSVVVVGQT